MDVLPELMDPAALERCAEEGSLERLIAGWSARLAGATSGDDALRRVILAALRIDLAVIVADPSLLFPCVYNRVYWHGSAEAAVFYGAGVDEGAPLRAWAERWRESRGRRGAWARSLRPPEFPLLAALREEYRAGLQGRERPSFSPDGTVLGFASEPALAWERATGRRLAASEVARRLGPVAGAAFELDRSQHTWGRARVRDRRSGALVVDVDVDGDSSFGCVEGLPDGTGVLVAGWCDDYDGVIARIDLPKGKVRWRVRIGGQTKALVCDPTGARVLAVDGTQVHLLDGTSGAALASLPLAAQSVALSPDGATLATLLGDVVRVWDVAALRAGEPRRLRGADEGWVGAEFSPDGRTLLTGKLLCDARDGRLIARLDLDGPGYLEGGPPRHGRRLADDRFVEMSPMRGVVAFSTRDGARVLADRSRRYGLSHRIALAPDARWYVRGRDRWQEPVALCRIDDGAVVAELGVADSEPLAFSPDSARLFVATPAGVVRWHVAAGTREGIWPHPAEVTGLAVSIDGTCVVTGARDGMLRAWDVARGSLRGSRPLMDDDPLARLYDAKDGESSVWRATPEALAKLEGWLGFKRATQPRTARRSDGLLEIVEAGRVRVRVVTHIDLVADPAGTRWAMRADHFALADADD